MDTAAVKRSVRDRTTLCLRGCSSPKTATNGGKISDRLPPVSFTLDDYEEQFCVTLKPGEPSRFNATFGLAYDMSNNYDRWRFPGHEYLCGVRPCEQMDWWRKGRKEDVLDLPDENRGAYHADGLPIGLNAVNMIEFKVLALES
jgi:hypothetical protein